MLAPICLFTYNRLNETQQTVETLKRNYLASESDLLIFSDGAKNDNDRLKVENVRQYIESIAGFKSVEIRKSQENQGLASSIIKGIAYVLEKYEKVIVLEDDLITSPNFLNFMNQALEFYKNDKKIQSINGYSFSLTNISKEAYFQTRTGSWGWATWKDHWNIDIFNKDNLKAIINSNFSILKEFKNNCGADMPKMLLNSINNKNDSWYVRWAFDHFRNQHFSVFPVNSFISNIGHNKNATHSKGINAYTSVPVNPDQTEFDLPDFQPPDKQSTVEFLSYFSLKHKITIRIKLLKTKNGWKQLFNEVKMKIGLK